MYFGDNEVETVMLGDQQVDAIYYGDSLVWEDKFPPLPITDFTASDLEIDAIVCTWTPTTGKPEDITYDLVNNDTDVVLASNISSGYSYSTTEASLNLRVDATNEAGTTPSNVDTGTTRAPAGSQTFSTPGSFVFNNPRGYTQVTLCMIGGGAGGTNFYPVGITYRARAGQIYSGVQAISGATTAVTVGAGGSVGGQPGGNGGATTFGTRTVSGGTSDSTNVNGGTRSTCHGTYNHGINGNPRDDRFRGGEAGLGNGGNAVTYDQGGQAGSGVRGGGGGMYDSRTGSGGAGGAGFIRVSWG